MRCTMRCTGCSQLISTSCSPTRRIPSALLRNLQSAHVPAAESHGSERLGNAAMDQHCAPS